MGIKITLLDKLCNDCGSNEQEISMKNPFIDDYETECSNINCSSHGVGLANLLAATRSQAKLDNM